MQPVFYFYPSVYPSAGVRRSEIKAQFANLRFFLLTGKVLQMNALSGDGDFADDYIYSNLVFVSRTEMLDVDEPYQYLYRHQGELVCHHPDGRNKTPIRSFSVCLVDPCAALNDHVVAYDVFDTEAGTFDVFEDLYDYETGALLERIERITFGSSYVPRGTILFLERLVVHPGHRGNGVGLLALSALLR